MGVWMREWKGMTAGGFVEMAIARLVEGGKINCALVRLLSGRDHGEAEADKRNDSGRSACGSRVFCTGTDPHEEGKGRALARGCEG